MYKYFQAMPKKFQSTLLHEERLRDFAAFAVMVLHFNPRSYMRSDKMQIDLLNENRDFNPRSYMRSDPSTAMPHGWHGTISIHAPT